MLALMRRANRTCAYVCIIKQARRVYGRASALAKQPQRADLSRECDIEFQYWIYRAAFLEIAPRKTSLRCQRWMRIWLWVDKWIIAEWVLISVIFTAWKSLLLFQSRIFNKILLKRYSSVWQIGYKKSSLHISLKFFHLRVKSHQPFREANDIPVEVHVGSLF
jgi:hypothetical protein